MKTLEAAKKDTSSVERRREIMNCAYCRGWLASWCLTTFSAQIAYIMPCPPSYCRESDLLGDFMFSQKSAPQTRQYCRALAVAGTTAWNSFPDNLRDPDLTTDNFKCLLKRFCFQRTSAISTLGVSEQCALQIYILFTYSKFQGILEFVGRQLVALCRNIFRATD